MTAIPFDQALRAGFDRLAAWADLLDAINVFPVADGDTGRNLQVSLAPLQAYQLEEDADRLRHQLLRSARGNSGNIATQFFSEFLLAPSRGIRTAVRKGSRAACRAVQNPREGTMLTVFDTLETQLVQTASQVETGAAEALLESLHAVVQDSQARLPRLNSAGVVDAGALGMYLFFEGFFWAKVGQLDKCRPPTRSFPGSLKISAAFQEQEDGGYCIDTVLEKPPDMAGIMDKLAGTAESVVSIAQGDMVKLHFHTTDRESTRRTLEASGGLVSWSEDDLTLQVKAFQQRPRQKQVHIVTDGAASLTRADQQQYGFTLLDSYIMTDAGALPETRIVAEDLYRRMRDGERVSTAQASDFERHQHYQRLVETHPETLYLCVGSVYTGNYDTAVAWQTRNDPQDRLHIIDSGAAAGRLAVMVLAAARLACRGADLETVAALAERSLNVCREYIFIDRLKYLAGGGRLSRPGALMGDLLHVKPVISPLPTGAEKIGSVKNRKEQLAFALRHLKIDLAQAASPLVLVEYTDNRDWVEAELSEAIAKRFPEVEIILQPLSLTTGSHTGPGTWAVAVHPDPENRRASSVAEPPAASAGQRAHPERILG